MPATLYFGAPVKPSQSAHKEATDLGLEMLRASPSEVIVQCIKDYKQPGHTLFSANLPAFIFLSQNPKSRVSSRNPIYYPLSSKSVSPTFSKPVVVFSFSRPLNSDQIAEVVRETGSVETRAGGKLAFRHQLSDSALYQKVLGLTPRPTPTTQSGTGEINIFSLGHYFFLHRLFDAFMRCNQYPGFMTNVKEDVGSFENFSPIGEVGKTITGIIDEESLSWVDALKSDGTQVSRDRNVIFHCNLNTPADKFDYVVESYSQLSTNMTGISLPYVTALTKTDYGVIPRVVQRYFLGCLGATGPQAADSFENLKSAWGNICKTPWGDELAHMYRGIEIALEAQATLRVVKTSQNLYRGLILYGGMFALHARGEIFRPVPRADLLIEMENSNPHVAALKFIYGAIYFPDEPGRVQARESATSLRDVNLILVSQGYQSNFEQEIRKKAHALTFPGAPYLSATAHNISLVFSAIADTTIPESNFPLHPDAITSKERTERLLSAFGSEVPVFRVPAGKTMSLEGKFAVKERGPSGASEEREIHAIGGILLPLARAYPAFKEMKDAKAVLNPFGSRLAAQASSSSRIKRWEKESGDLVVAALRLAVGASALVPNGKTKRSRDEDDDETGNKRVKPSAFDVDF